MRLSVIIITLNEAAGIGAVLDSVRFADEIIVLDSGSSDDTCAICRAHGARVEQVNDWPGFGPQKNRVLALAQGDWVLSLDADEVVSPALASEIEAVLARQDAADSTTGATAGLGVGTSDRRGDVSLPVSYEAQASYERVANVDSAAHSSQLVAWRIPRASSYCGRILRHGGWWPDHVMRLFRREGARFSDDRVHERLLPPPGRIGVLVHPLQHATYANLEEVLQKVDRYSTEGAAQAHSNGRRSGFSAAIGHGLWAFLRTYFLRAAFLDGPYGFMLAVSNAEATYYRYAKLWLLAQSREH